MEPIFPVRVTRLPFCQMMGWLIVIDFTILLCCNSVSCENLAVPSGEKEKWLPFEFN